MAVNNGSGGRLTLTSGTPVTIADATSTTIYFTPYNGGFVPLWDGSLWTMTSFAELSQTLADSTKSPAAAATSSVYDMFVWSDSGTIRCTRGPVWTNRTTRGYTLTLQNGVYMNPSDITNGPAALRGTWVGIIGNDATGANGTAQDTAKARFVINAYNKAPRSLFNCPGYVDDNAVTTYATTSTTFVECNAGTGSKTEFLTDGLQGMGYAAFSVMSHASGGSQSAFGVGEDSTTSAAQISIISSPGVGYNVHHGCGRSYIPALGYHYLDLLFASPNTGTVTCNADQIRGGSAADPYATYLSGIVWG